MSYQIAPYIGPGQQKVILTKHEPEPLPIHVLHRKRRYASAKVKTFIDLVVSTPKSEYHYELTVFP